MVSWNQARLTLTMAITLTAPDSQIEQQAEQVLRDMLVADPQEVGCVVALGLALFDAYPQTNIRIRQRTIWCRRDSFRDDTQQVYVLRLGNRLLGLGGWGTWRDQIAAQVSQTKEKVSRVGAAEECSVSPPLLIQNQSLEDGEERQLLLSLSRRWPPRADVHPSKRAALLDLASQCQTRLLQGRLERHTPEAPPVTPRSVRRL